ncbi:MAG: hypothetical protein FVQ81_02065 [Candidatus Glassbacteria bacterium]|nr:hypothetical protein [Candidatus Glassbacteria bacterium]
MNVAKAVGFLAERFGDLGENKFTGRIKVDLLENAELDLANKLHPAYLTELEVPEEQVAYATEFTLLSALANNVLGGAEGILTVRLTGGKYCRKIDPRKIKDTESYYRTGSDEDPMYYVEGNRINILANSASGNIDVTYRKVPGPLYYLFTVVEEGTPSTTLFKGTAGEGLSATNDAYNGAVIYNVTNDTYHVVTDYVGATLQFTVTAEVAGAPRTFDSGDKIRFLTHDFDLLNLASVEFTLNPSLHETVLLLTEAAGWAQTPEVSRRDGAWDKAVASINTLNAKYKEPEVLGTQKQGR